MLATVRTWQGRGVFAWQTFAFFDPKREQCTQKHIHFCKWNREREREGWRGPLCDTVHCNVFLSYIHWNVPHRDEILPQANSYRNTREGKISSRKFRFLWLISSTEHQQVCVRVYIYIFCGYTRVNARKPTAKLHRCECGNIGEIHNDADLLCVFAHLHIATPCTFCTILRRNLCNFTASNKFYFNFLTFAYMFQNLSGALVWRHPLNQLQNFVQLFWSELLLSQNKVLYTTETLLTRVGHLEFAVLRFRSKNTFGPKWLNK